MYPTLMLSIQPRISSMNVLHPFKCQKTKAKRHSPACLLAMLSHQHICSSQSLEMVISSSNVFPRF
ncbi:unnamed protein product [Periconia digitata]|uniref:Uncharacterized protein n=1 Tax=Periconia digitata TaxID=1303443 RepID=A0A9W4UEU7_9PLEO|nr:unnamed protein product [Periconia digitata]